VKKPNITVVIPTRNRWPILSTRALPSALVQEDVEHEVIVVDDGSTDETPARLAELDDTRLRIMRNEEPTGVARARNAGLAAARGEWIAFLDDDDAWSARKLRLQLDAAAGDDAFVYSAIAKLGEDGQVTELPPPPPPADLPSTILSRNVVRGGSSNVLARTKIVRELGGFDERLSQLCDWDLWIRLANAGPAAVSADVSVACFDHRQSMLLGSGDEIFEEFEYIAEKHSALAAARGVSVDRAVFVRWVALGRLRAGRRVAAARLYLRAAREGRSPADVVRALIAAAGPRAMALARRAARGADRPTGAPSAAEWLSAFRPSATQERAEELQGEMPDRAV
jgi:glycosyltransferase involved in cell wall biosynthesis